MIRRNTWIVLFVLAILVGFTIYFQRFLANKTETLPTATPSAVPVKLYDLANFQVDDIKIADNTGKKIDLYKDSGTSNWAIAGIASDKADSSQIEGISTELFSLHVQDSLSQSAPLDSVGLDTPSYTITLTTTDGAQLITYIGSQTAIGSGYYVRVGSGQIVIVDKVTMDAILNLLKNPPLLPTATPIVTPSETNSPGATAAQATATP